MARLARAGGGPGDSLTRLRLDLGFGQSGPSGNRTAYDLIVQGMTA